MNCREVGKFIYAFADGELDTEQNLPVLEHLNVCPSCARKVNLQSELRDRLRDLEAGVRAPDRLRAGVLAAIAAERAGSGQAASASGRQPHAPGKPAAEPPGTAPPRKPLRISSHRPPLWRRQWVHALGLAAVIGLASVSIYRSMWPTPYADSVSDTSAHVTDRSPGAVRLANYVEQLHLGCAGEGPGHHDARLGATEREAATALEQKLHIAVAMMPTSCGVPIAFESAHVCPVQDADGRLHDAAHLIYRQQDQARAALSLISLPALPEVARLKPCPNNHCSILAPAGATDLTPMSVLAWNSNEGATYIFCGPLSPSDAAHAVRQLTRGTLQAGMSPSRPGWGLAWGESFRGTEPRAGIPSSGTGWGPLFPTLLSTGLWPPGR